MPNIPKIKWPQSPFVDKSGNVAREWQQWLLNPQFITLNLDTVLAVGSGGTGITDLPSDGELLIGGNGSYFLSTLTPVANRTSVINGVGSITFDISAAYTGQTSITTLGTITTGAWSASTIAATRGGTGLSGYAVGDLVYADSTTSLSKLADVAIGSALVSGGIGVAPSWGKIGLTTHISGTLAAGNGGTGQSGYTTGDILYASSASVLSKLAIGSANYIFGVSAGGTGPEYKQLLGTANQVTITHAAGSITYSLPQSIATTSNVTFGSVTSTGAFGCNGKVAQTASAVNAAIAGSAGATYTATEQGLINSLIAQINLLRTALVNNGIAV